MSDVWTEIILTTLKLFKGKQIEKVHVNGLNELNYSFFNNTNVNNSSNICDFISLLQTKVKWFSCGRSLSTVNHMSFGLNAVEFRWLIKEQGIYFITHLPLEQLSCLDGTQDDVCNSGWPRVPLAVSTPRLPPTACLENEMMDCLVKK